MTGKRVFQIGAGGSLLLLTAIVAYARTEQMQVLLQATQHLWFVNYPLVFRVAVLVFLCLNAIPVIAAVVLTIGLRAIIGFGAVGTCATLLLFVASGVVLWWRVIAGYGQTLADVSADGIVRLPSRVNHDCTSTVS
jgi:hypothetical protein